MKSYVEIITFILNMQKNLNEFMGDMVSLVWGFCCTEVIPCPERGLRNECRWVGRSSSSRWLQELLGKKPEVLWDFSSYQYRYKLQWPHIILYYRGFSL